MLPHHPARKALLADATSPRWALAKLVVVKGSSNPLNEDWRRPSARRRACSDHDAVRPHLFLPAAQVHIATFWLPFLFYSACNRFGWFQRYRLAGAANLEFPPEQLILKALKTEAANHFLIQPLAGYYLLYPAFTYFGCPIRAPLPHWSVFLYSIIGFALVNDVIFYFAHRAFHTPALYAKIHKQHHEFKGLASPSSEYANPVEDLTNALATLIGPMVTNCHMAVFLVFFWLRIWETQEAHSGYCFPSPWQLLHDPARRHAYHHSVNRGQYSAFGFMDAIFGTQGKSYPEWMAAVRATAPGAAKKAA